MESDGFGDSRFHHPLLQFKVVPGTVLQASEYALCWFALFTKDISGLLRNRQGFGSFGFLLPETNIPAVFLRVLHLRPNQLINIRPAEAGKRTENKSVFDNGDFAFCICGRLQFFQGRKSPRRMLLNIVRFIYRSNLIRLAASCFFSSIILA